LTCRTESRSQSLLIQPKRTASRVRTSGDVHEMLDLDASTINVHSSMGLPWKSGKVIGREGKRRPIMAPGVTVDDGACRWRTAHYAAGCPAAVEAVICVGRRVGECERASSVCLSVAVGRSGPLRPPAGG
jgi:hypothetical protein